MYSEIKIPSNSVYHRFFTEITKLFIEHQVFSNGIFRSFHKWLKKSIKWFRCRKKNVVGMMNSITIHHWAFDKIMEQIIVTVFLAIESLKIKNSSSLKEENSKMVWLINILFKRTQIFSLRNSQFLLNQFVTLE